MKKGMRSIRLLGLALIFTMVWREPSVVRLIGSKRSLNSLRNDVVQPASIAWDLKEGGKLSLGTSTSSESVGASPHETEQRRSLLDVILDPGFQNIDFDSISVGRWHSCGITADRSGYCWGDNDYGQLGDDSKVGRSDPVEIAFGGYLWSSVSVGDEHTCGIMADGSGYCWGYNNDGQLGDGTGSDHSLPNAIDGGKYQWRSLSAGGYHTCGITTAGAGYCWGHNDAGQLGDGTKIARSVPVEIDGGKFQWAVVSAGRWHTCGITVDGIRYCWGGNSVGELGDGAATDSPIPVSFGNEKWSDVSAGGSHTCGITVDGSGFCWGYNEYGQLGIGTTTESYVPVVIDGGNDRWTLISAVVDNTCGIATSGTRYCWGLDENGELFGDGVVSRSIPTQIQVQDQSPQPESPPLVVLPPSPTSPPTSTSPPISLPTSLPISLPTSPPPSSLTSTSTSPPPITTFINPTETAANTSKGSSIDPGLIGGIVGGVLGAMALALAAFFFYKGGKKRSDHTMDISSARAESRRASLYSDESFLKKEETSFGSIPIDQPFFNTAGIANQTSSMASRRAFHADSNAFMSTASYQTRQSIAGNRIQSTPNSSRQPLISHQDSDIIVFQQSEFQLEARIGEGSFGQVFKASWKRTDVAFKVLGERNGVMTLSNSDAETLGRELQKEASLMAKLRHPNIVQFLGICLSPPCLVTEYCSKGSLTKLLFEARTDPTRALELTWQRRLGLLADAGRGVLYLHTHSPNPILHRDLKSPNILVSHFWTAKVADFGLSKVLEEYQGRNNTTDLALNPRWLPPEVLDGRPFTMAADVFAFGVVMWEVLSCELPWTSMGEWVIMNQVSSGERLQIPRAEEIPGEPPPHCVLSEYISLMEQCWSQDPSDRPRFEAIVDKLMELQSYVA